MMHGLHPLTLLSMACVGLTIASAVLAAFACKEPRPATGWREPTVIQTKLLSRLPQH